MGISRTTALLVLCATAALILASPHSPVVAQERLTPGFTQTFALGSKSLTIVRGDSNSNCGDCADGEEEVLIEGRLLLEDAIVNPRRRYTGAEADAVVLELNNAGNGFGCRTRYAIAWVSKAGAFGATEPFYDGCWENPDFIVTPGQIVVRFPPWIRRDGLIYRWTFKGGLEAPAIEEFAPDLERDWGWLPERSDGADIFENAGVYAAFKVVLGRNFEEFRTYFDRYSSTETIGDGVIVGAAATRTWDSAVFAIDAKRERVFAAMPSSQGWRFYPNESEWPIGLKSQLAAKFPSETRGFE
ncbi:hypothetical protein [Dongia sp.]|uniref:hypothetical protein n=1 Tax=Dongia sp. TaxID=1977262 RepID=UPI0037506E13